MPHIPVAITPVKTERGSIVFVDMKVHPIETPVGFRNVLDASYKSPPNFFPSELFIDAEITQIRLKIVSSGIFSKAYGRGNISLNAVQPRKTEWNFRIGWLKDKFLKAHR